MKDTIKLINFLELTLDEKIMVLEWRNDNRIRDWMYNSNIITKEEHFNFINSLTKKQDKYFLLKQSNIYLGVIDFTQINNACAHMGIYSNPNIKGLGEKLLDTIISYGTKSLNLNRIIAEVYVVNKKAIELYERKKFKVIGKKLFKEKEILIMELQNENC